jgi:hypothetical protein
MFFEIIQPDGSIVREGPREIALAETWAFFNKDLAFLVRLIRACSIGESFEFNSRNFKRIK